MNKLYIDFLDPMHKTVSTNIQILKSTLFGVLVLDTNGNIDQCNEKACTMLQATEDWIVGKPIYKILSDFPLLIGTEELSEGTWTGRLESGKKISIQYSYSPSIDSNNHEAGHLIIAESVPTLIHNSFRESTSYDFPDFHLSDAIINSMPGIFYLFTSEGQFLRWNDNFEKVTGYTTCQIREKHPLDFFDIDEKDLVKDKITSVFDLGFDSVEANFLLKDGTKIPYFFTGSYLEFEGEQCLLGVGIDISQRILAKRSLEHTNKQLRSAQQIARIGYWEWNWADNVSYWSDEMYELCGCDKSQGPMDQIQFVKSIHTGDLASLDSERKRIVETKEQGEAEFRFFMPSGEMRYFRVQTSAVVKPNGEFLRLEGTLHDITDRKKGEEILSKSNERYELISKATNDAIWDWDINNNQITGNKNLYELFDLEVFSDRFDDRMFQSKIHPEDVNRVRAKTADALFARKGVISQEYRFLHPDQTWRVILERSQVIYDKNGMPVRMLGAMQDITEQKSSEVTLQEITNRLLLATTSAKLGIFDWNIGRDRMVWNQYMYEIFEVSPSDFDHSFQSWLDCFHAKDVALFDLKNNSKLLNKRKMNETIRVVLSTEDIRYVEIHAILLPNENGKVTSVIGVCRDITDKVNAEQQINRTIINTQEEERFETGRELHDNVIQVLIASLMNLNHAKDRDPNNTPLENGLQHTKNAINEIRRLSHQLAPSNLGQMAMDEAIKDLLKNMNSQEYFKVSLKFDLDNGNCIPDEVKLNIYRIVQEQLNNIHKHSGATKISIELGASKNRVWLKTKDNGKGFDLTKAHYGIGLHNIQRRVKVFEGEISINTAPNKGCQMIIDIPFNDHPNS
ncbi:MAG: PAS domain-containing protein [Marinoscillum sp.]